MFAAYRFSQVVVTGYEKMTQMFIFKGPAPSLVFHASEHGVYCLNIFKRHVIKKGDDG